MVYIVPTDHCQQHKAPDVLFLKDMHVFCPHVSCCMFITHTLQPRRHPGVFSMLTDYRSYPVFFYNSCLFNREQSYLKLFEALLYSNSSKQIDIFTPSRDLSVHSVCLPSTTLPDEKLLISSKYSCNDM